MSTQSKSRFPSNPAPRTMSRTILLSISVFLALFSFNRTDNQEIYYFSIVKGLTNEEDTEYMYKDHLAILIKIQFYPNPMNKSFQILNILKIEIFVFQISNPGLLFNPLQNEYMKKITDIDKIHDFLSAVPALIKEVFVSSRSTLGSIFNQTPPLYLINLIHPFVSSEETPSFNNSTGSTEIETQIQNQLIEENLFSFEIFTQNVYIEIDAMHNTHLIAKKGLIEEQSFKHLDSLPFKLEFDHPSGYVSLNGELILKSLKLDINPESILLEYTTIPKIDGNIGENLLLNVIDVLEQEKKRYDVYEEGSCMKLPSIEYKHCSTRIAVMNRFGWERIDEILNQDREVKRKEFAEYLEQETAKNLFSQDSFYNLSKESSGWMETVWGLRDVRKIKYINNLENDEGGLLMPYGEKVESNETTVNTDSKKIDFTWWLSVIAGSFIIATGVSLCVVMSCVYKKAEIKEASKKHSLQVVIKYNDAKTKERNGTGVLV